jgi:hypothetical protein
MILRDRLLPMATRMKTKQIIFGLLAFCLIITPRFACAVGTWSQLANQPGSQVGTMLLLSDGTVMALNNNNTTQWFRLTPDASGSYLNGSWSYRASMNYSRLYFSSDVLQDGRVLVAGGEYGTGTTNAEIYDPVQDAWTIVPIPSGIINTENTVNTEGQNTSGFEDSASILLSNGCVLITPVIPASYGNTAIFNPDNNSWSTSSLVRGGDEDEAGLVKLPDDSILVVDSETQNSERYIPSSGNWVDDAVMPFDLWDPYVYEIGPGILLPNGKVLWIGSQPFSAIYTPSGTTSPGSWVQGPDLPNEGGAPDAPAAMMPNGKVLLALSDTPSVNNVYPADSFFYEYDYSVAPAGAFTATSAPGTGGTYYGTAPYPMRFLVLPDGNILATTPDDGVWIYQPDGAPLPAGKPTIYSIVPNYDGGLTLTGTLFNGLSQGAVYGDDAQMDSNYPLVRFIDTNGVVRYGRTYNWSSTSVDTGNAILSTECTIPTGGSTQDIIEVVANGIASDPGYYDMVWADFNFYEPYGFYIGSYSDPYNTMSSAVNGVASGGTIVIKASASSETLRITKAMRIISSGGTSSVGH